MSARSMFGLCVLACALSFASLGEAVERWIVATGGATTGNCLTTGTACTFARAQAVVQPGDEVIARDGTYQGQFSITTTSGTSGSPITLRAENRHQAIFQHTKSCVSGAEAPGLRITRPYWIIKDLYFRQHQRAIFLDTVANVTVQHNLIEDYTEDGVTMRWPGTTGNIIEYNAIGHAPSCITNRDSAAVRIITDADANIVRHNVIVAIGDNGYQAADPKLGYGVLIANNSDNNQVLGNLLLAVGGKAVFRVLAGVTQISGDNNIARGNIFLWGEGGIGSSDCVDSGTVFENNISYGNYFQLMSNKGNDGNQYGMTYANNLFWMDRFARTGLTIGNTGDGTNCRIVKYDQDIKNNIFYSPDNLLSGQHHLLVLDDQSLACDVCNYNLFWANNSSISSWTSGYTAGANDIRNFSTPPIFVDAPGGDFTLASGSPGKNSGDNGQDRGITYNTELKKIWVQNSLALPTQEKTGLGTSTTFPVSTSHYYQVYFHIPNSGACSITETFTVEGTALTRNIATLRSTANSWIQENPVGPARWITLGRHRATDGTLNVSWTTSSCADAIFVRQLPTITESYQWILAATAGDTTAPAIPTGLTVTAISATRLDVEFTPPADGDLASYELAFCSGSTTCTPDQSNPIVLTTANTQGCTPSPGTDVCYAHTNLLSETPYRYQVRAKDTSNNASAYTAIVTTSTQAGPPPSLELHLPLDEASGTTAGDDSGNALDGTVAGGAVWDTPGLIFDGIDDRVSVPRDPQIEPTSVTTCLFVTPDGPQGGNYADLLNKTYQNDTASPNTSYALMLNSAGLGDTVVSFAIGTASGSQFLHSDVGAIPDGTRVHVCGVYDPAGPPPQQRLYVGGNLHKSAVLNAPIVYDLTSTGNLYLGSNGGTRFRFKGLLEDVRVYDGALPDNAIATLALGTPADVGAFSQSAYCWTRVDHPETQACQGNIGTSFKAGIPGRIVQRNQARVRVAITRTVDTSPLTEFVLYARSPAGSGEWWALNDDCGSNPFCYGVDGRLENGTGTTAQLIAAGDFATGGKIYTAGHPRLDQVSIPAGKSMEYEAVIRAAPNTTTGTTIGLCMRYSDGTELDSCSEATATVSAPISYGP